MMKFNMVSLTPGQSLVTSPGPLVDDGAPYSGLGVVELRSLAPCLLPDWDGTLQPDRLQRAIPSTVCLKLFALHRSGGMEAANMQVQSARYLVQLSFLLHPTRALQYMFVIS